MPAQSHQLHKATVLKALEPRRDPYWGAPLAKGRHVGYRKLDATRGSWIARFSTDDGTYKFSSLGLATADFGFDQAKEAASEWFASQETGVSATGVTVEAACKAYVLDRRKNSSEENAHDAHMRFMRTVYGKDLGARALAKLTTAVIKRWRDGLALAPQTKNRTMTVLKAALNLAVVDRRVSSAKSIEWENVKQLDYVREHHGTYLDIGQRRKLLKMAGTGAFYDLLLAATLTGARPGEIVKAKRRQFDARNGSMTFIGKTSRKTVPRTVLIQDGAIELFKRRAKGLEPNDLLFTRDDGKPWAHSDWDQLVKSAAMAAKLPDTTVLYSLRHSWITEALTGGRMNILDVSKFAGTSIKMIQETYGHLIESSARESLKTVNFI
jgi:integrase